MLLIPDPRPRQTAKATAPGNQSPDTPSNTAPRTMSAAETIASAGGDRPFPKAMLIRRLMTCAGPNSDPITTAALPSPIAPSIGTMWASIAARVNPESEKAMETSNIPRRRACGSSAPTTTSRVLVSSSLEPTLPARMIQ
ncbi:hypothetical protein D9M72_588820 [compost metagenome]